MPPRRATRASSAEAGTAASTRTSRRLRSQQNQDASPLRALSPPRRRRNISASGGTGEEPGTCLEEVFAAKKAARMQKKRTMKMKKNAQAQLELEPGQSQVSVNATIGLALEEASKAKDNDHDTLMTTGKASSSPELLKDEEFIRTYQENPAAYERLTLENVHLFYTPEQITKNREAFQALLSYIQMMTDQYPDYVVVKLVEQKHQLVAADAKLSSAEREIQKQKTIADDASHDLEIAQREIQTLKEKLGGKERPTPLKRSTPSESEDDIHSNERPARRQKTELSTRETTPSQQSSSSPPHRTPQPEESTEQFPITTALSQQNSSPQFNDMFGTDDIDDSFINPAPTHVENEFQKYVRELILKKEKEKKQQESLAAVLKNPDLDISDQEGEGEEDAAENPSEDGFADNDDSDVPSSPPVDQSHDQDREHNSPPSESDENSSTALIRQPQTTSALSPIREESEPRTPASTRRWGISSIFAPVTRLFGATPRTEPVRRIVQQVVNGVTAPTTTPTSNQNYQRPEADSPTPNNSNSNNHNQQSTTPVRDSGITSANFEPQSAPQPRAVRQTQMESARRRKSHAEKIKAYDEAAAKRQEAEERAKEAAREAEDERVRKQAAEYRQQSIAAIEAKQKTGEKRKVRVDDLEVIPRPQNGYGMIDEYFEEDSDGEVYVDEDVSMDDVFTPPPAKRARTDDGSPSQSQTEPNQQMSSQPQSSQQKPWWQLEETFRTVSPHAKTPARSVTSDPHRAQPYTGTMFADTTKDARYDGGNVFEQTQNREGKKNAQDSILSPISYGQKYHVWIAPKSPPKERPANFNYAGHFAVPDDSDSDSDPEESITSPTPTQKERSNSKSRSRNKSRSPEKTSEEPHGRTNIFMQRSEAANGNEATADDQEDSSFSQQPPPTPTPAHAALPSTPGTITIDSNALAKARSQAEKYKPKTPSGLRAASRLSTSPMTATPSATEGGNTATPFASATAGANASQFNNGFDKPPASTSSLSTDPQTSEKPTSDAAQTATALTNSVPASGHFATALAPKIIPLTSDSTIPISPAVSSSQPVVTVDTFDENEDPNLPYEQTIQYAIDLADAVPEDELPEIDFEWAELAEYEPLDAEVEAALDEAERHPDFELYADEMYGPIWANALAQGRAGRHNDVPSAAPPASPSTPISV